MKIHNKTVFQMTDNPEEFILLEDDFYEHSGPVSEAKGGGTTQVQKADPWEGAQPYLKDIFSRAQGIGQTQYFPGSTVAPQSSQTRQGIQAMFNMPGRTQGVYDQLGNLATSGGIDPFSEEGKALATVNPAQLEAATEPLLENIRSQFAASGRYGPGGMMGGAMGKAVGQAAAGLYGDERNRQMSLYDADRARQMQALGMFPQMDQMRTQSMLGAGSMMDQYSQAQLSDQVARFQQQQNAPWEQLQRYASIVSPGAGLGGTTTTTGPGGSTGAGALGGALAGAQLGSIIPGIGTGIGAIGGGLLGGFF